MSINIKIRAHKTFEKQKPNINRIVAKVNILTLLAKDIERFSTKSSKCFLYSFVLIINEWKLADPFAARIEDNNKKGVVGHTGRNTPISAHNKKTKDNNMYIVLIITLLLSNIISIKCSILKLNYYY